MRTGPEGLGHRGRGHREPALALRGVRISASPRTDSASFRRCPCLSSFPTTVRTEEISMRTSRRPKSLWRGLIGTLVASCLGASTALAAPFAYVGHSTSDGNVAVIDTATNTVVTNVTAGHNPVAVAVHPRAPRAYVANAGDATVSVLDTDTNSVVATVPVGSSPRAIAVRPDSQRVYVANSGGGVSVIDAANALLTTIPVGDNPVGIAVRPDGQVVYVANQNSGTVSAISTATNAVTATITLGGNPRGVAVTPDGLRAYVTDFLNGQVFVLDTATNTAETSIP